MAHRPEEPVKDPEGKVPRWTPEDERLLTLRVRRLELNRRHGMVATPPRVS